MQLRQTARGARMLNARLAIGLHVVFPCAFLNDSAVFLVPGFPSFGIASVDVGAVARN